MAFLGGCAYLPAAGPSKRDIEHSTAQPGVAVIQIVDVDDQVTRQLLAQRSQRLGPRDVVEVSIREAPPAALFGASVLDMRGTSASVHATTLPEEMIDSDGTISVPGRLAAWCDRGCCRRTLWGHSPQGS